MFLVETRIMSLHDGETVEVDVIIEEWIKGVWVQKEKIEEVYGKSSPMRRFILVDGERLRVEGRSRTEIVWDKEQNAAVRRPVKKPEIPMLNLEENE